MKTPSYLDELPHLLASSQLPVLVCFYTAYCGASRLLNSSIEQINNQMKEQLKVVKVDSEEYPQLANRYQIHALPTLLLFNKGQLVERIESESTEIFMSGDRLIQHLQTLTSNLIKTR